MQAVKRLLGLDVPMLEPARRQFRSNVLFNAINGALWAWLVGVVLVGAFFFVLYTIMAWYVPVKEESALTRFARSFMVAGFAAGAVWAFRKQVLGVAG